MDKLRAQSSLEFLYATGLMLLLFVMVSIIFYESYSDSQALYNFAEARRICTFVTSQVSSVVSSGNGTAVPLSMPPTLGGRGYSVFISAQNRSASVIYAEGGVGCLLSTSNVSNGTAGNFYITNSATIQNVGGGVVIG